MKIVEARKDLNLSQAQAAKNIGISQSMLAMLETKQRSGSDDTKKKVARYYHISVEDLFFDDVITYGDNDD